MTKKFTLPQSTNPNQTIDVIETEGIIVVIGANGTGKTRLGSWIEFSPGSVDKVHRVSAQKSLSIPPTIPIESIGKARSLLYYGLDTDSFPNWPVGLPK